MTNFKDLKFTKRFDGVGSLHKFDNGITLSVVAGVGRYCTPRESHPSADSYSSFEVGIWGKDGRWLTQDIVPNHDNDVIGWQSREDINEIISLIKLK